MDKLPYRKTIIHETCIWFSIDISQMVSNAIKRVILLQIFHVIPSDTDDIVLLAEIPF